MATNRLRLVKKEKAKSYEVDATERIGDVYERVGMAVAEYLEARHQGRYVAIESYIVQFPPQETSIARECFEAAEALFDLTVADAR